MKLKNVLRGLLWRQLRALVVVVGVHNLNHGEIVRCRYLRGGAFN